MQLEYEEKEDAYLRQKEVDITTPANFEHMPHREPVLRITSMTDGIFAAVSQVMARRTTLRGTEGTGEPTLKYLMG